MGVKQETFICNSIKFWEWVEWNSSMVNQPLEGWICSIREQNFRKGKNWVAYFICKNGDYKVFILTSFLKNFILNLKEIYQTIDPGFHLTNLFFKIIYKGATQIQGNKLKLFHIEVIKGVEIDLNLLLSKPPYEWKINPNKQNPNNVNSAPNTGSNTSNTNVNVNTPESPSTNNSLGFGDFNPLQGDVDEDISF